MTTSHSPLMTVERIHPKAPVMLIFIAIFTCLPSCINLSNISTLVSNGVNKALNKKKRLGGNIKIDLSPTDIRKIKEILQKLSNMKLTNYRSINQQTGKGIFTSLLIPLIGSMIPSLKVVKKIIFLKN